VDKAGDFMEEMLPWQGIYFFSFFLVTIIDFK